MPRATGSATTRSPTRARSARREQARHEIEAVELGELAHPDKLFRPSGAGGDLEPGLLNRDAVDTLVAGGYTCVLWNAVPGDWEDPDGWVDRALAQVADARLDAARPARRPRRGGGATREFLDRVEATFRQDFPPACVPIRGGRITGSLDGLV